MNNEKTVKEAEDIEISVEEKKTVKEESKEVEDKPIEKMSKKELSEKVEELKRKMEENYDLYLRSQADLNNIIKRNKKDKEDWIKYSNETLIKEILPVIDNLEMALSHSNNEKSIDALREGVELTLKGLKDVLVKSGLKELKAEGEMFDPCYHHAICEQESSEVEPGIIINELQKGYMLNDRLIRPAMVVLSKGNSDFEKNNDTASENACEE
ncbi:MAG: nucleotide exchange factor GrpE [Deltaproteobacteria bacterium]|nr:nucleotide exchange factor GrpE [Deltaproteobacteria bacterium]